MRALLHPPRHVHALLHPVALAALALWLVNDHVLKSAMPGALTGKLSDVAGMIVAPIALHAAVVTVTPRSWRASRTAQRALPWCAFLLVAVVFGAVKTSTAANELWRDAATAARAPIHALAVHLYGAPFGERAILVRDPTDLVALPFGLVAVWITSRVGSPRASRSPASPRGPSSPALPS